MKTDYTPDNTKSSIAILFALAVVVIAIAAVIDNSDEEWPEVWPVLNLLLPNGETLEVTVSSDEEGNGPGHLFIDAVS